MVLVYTIQTTGEATAVPAVDLTSEQEELVWKTTTFVDNSDNAWWQWL